MSLNYQVKKQILLHVLIQFCLHLHNHTIQISIMALTPTEQGIIQLQALSVSSIEFCSVIIKMWYLDRENIDTEENGDQSMSFQLF
jgi:hypothetical protein